MATRALIGLQLDDGSIVSAYHHWDGYPAWLGKILTVEYNTKEKVEELIDGGDMSSCWSDKIWGDKLPEGQYAPEYYSARGENCPPKLYKDLNEYATEADRNYCAEYIYNFVDGEWKCYSLALSDKGDSTFEDVVMETELNTVN